MIALPIDPFDAYVGQQIRFARIAAGESQEDLGDALDIVCQQIQKYERGTNSISHKKLYQIAQRYEKPIGYFTDGYPGGEPFIDDSQFRPRGSMYVMRLYNGMDTQQQNFIFKLLKDIVSDDGIRAECSDGHHSSQGGQIMNDYRAQANLEALQNKLTDTGLNPKQLAAAMDDITNDRIADILSGKEHMTAPELYSFCEFFGCKLEDFYIGVYDFGKLYSEFPKTVTQEFREKVLLNYFRRIKTPNAQDHLCALVKAIATDSVILEDVRKPAKEG